MLQYDAWYSKISRLTLDGAGKAAIALQYGPHFSTYNETSDNVIKTRPGQTTPTVQMTPRGDQTFLGNTYTYKDAVQVGGRNRRIAEKVVDASTID